MTSFEVHNGDQPSGRFSSNGKTPERTAATARGSRGDSRRNMMFLPSVHAVDVPALWNDFAPVETLASLDALDLTKLDTSKVKLEDEVDTITEAAGPTRMSTN